MVLKTGKILEKHSSSDGIAKERVKLERSGEA